MYYIPARQLPDSAYLPKAEFAQTPQQTGNPGRSAEGFNLVDAEGKLRNIGGKLNNRSKRSEKSMPSTPFEGEEHSVKTFSRNPTKSIENTVNGDEPSNVLFGPNGTLRNFTKSQVALTEFKKKQILKGNKRAEVAGLQNPEPNKKQYGFRTRFILNDLFTDKAMRARNARNMMSEDIKEHFVADEFAPFKDPVFRDLDLPFGKKEINLLYRCSMAENPFNMSAMNTQPRMVQNKEVKEREALEARRKDEYEKALQGDKPRIKDLTWTQYHHVPEKLKPISHGLKDYYLGDKKFKAHDKPFLPKDKFGDDTTLLVLARQMRDGEILGKPNLNLYFKPTKARDDDIDVEFGRVQKKYKTIY